MGDTYDVIMAAYPAVEAAQKDFDALVALPDPMEAGNPRRGIAQGPRGVSRGPEDGRLLRPLVPPRARSPQLASTLVIG